MHYNDIIKEWLHFMTSESKEWFSVNVWLSILTGYGENPIFFNKKKKKIGRPEHSLTSHPLTSDNILFLSYLPPLSTKVGVICVSPLILSMFDIAYRAFFFRMTLELLETAWPKSLLHYNTSNVYWTNDVRHATDFLHPQSSDSQGK